MRTSWKNIYYTCIPLLYGPTQVGKQHKITNGYLRLHLQLVALCILYSVHASVKFLYQLSIAIALNV